MSYFNPSESVWLSRGTAADQDSDATTAPVASRFVAMVTMLCLLASANGYVTYPRSPCYLSMSSNERSVHHGKMMSIEIRSMRVADISDAAELLSRTFAPPDGYNAIQSAIVYKETVSGLTDRLNQVHRKP